MPEGMSCEKFRLIPLMKVRELILGIKCEMTHETVQWWSHKANCRDCVEFLRHQFLETLLKILFFDGNICREEVDRIFETPGGGISD